MLKELVKLANHLDSKGLVKEADYLDRIIKSADDDSIIKHMPSTHETPIPEPIITNVMNNGMSPSIGVNTEGKTSIDAHRAGEDRCLVWLDIEGHIKREGKDLFSGTIYWGPGRSSFSEIHSEKTFKKVTGESLKKEVNEAFDKCNQKIMTSNDLNINDAKNAYSEIPKGSKHMVDFGDKSLILQVPTSDTDWMTIDQVEKALGTFTGN